MISSDPSPSSAVLVGQIVSITCSAVCIPVQTLILYKSPSGDVTEVAVLANQGTHGVNLDKEDNGVNFYCDVQGWSSDVRSNAFSFNVQCECQLTE